MKETKSQVTVYIYKEVHEIGTNWGAQLNFYRSEENSWRPLSFFETSEGLVVS